MLRQRTGRDVGVDVRLWKRIPMAAGLAGGSTDAAATLAGLNALWRLGLGRDELAGLGAELGSDVPFFFATPAAWCTGRGEMVDAGRRWAGRSIWCWSVRRSGWPRRRCFGSVDACPPAPRVRRRQSARRLAAGDVEEIGRRLHNRLQPAAERLCPAVARAGSQRLAALRAGGQLMSGSGSTLFALCRDRRTRLCAIARGV